MLQAGSAFFTHYRRASDAMQTHFCPGCGHGNLLKFVDAALNSLGLSTKAVWISPVGCGGLTDAYLSMAHILAPHGRASAVGTAVKRLHPEALVIVSQGDGDMASIGLCEAIHSANRAESLTVIFVNNGNFGMTGGQMSPTTLLGQATPTSWEGRCLADHGGPMRMCEMLMALEGPSFIARVAIGSDKQLVEAERVICRAIERQYLGLGYSFVEVLSPCPSNWRCSPQAARAYVSEVMAGVYPLGVFRDAVADGGEALRGRADPEPYEVERVLEAMAHLTRHCGGICGEVSAYYPLRLSSPLSVVAAGFGGQGVLTLGRVLAHLALVSGLEASWLPSYGPEMRGGLAHCHIRIGTDAVASPMVTEPGLVFAMNQPSFDTFHSRLAPGGRLVYDADLVVPGQCREDVTLFGVRATQLCDTLGRGRSANIAMLAAGLMMMGIVGSREALVEAMSEAIGEDVSEIVCAVWPGFV